MEKQEIVCPRCNVIFTRKYNLNRHLNKKKKCIIKAGYKMPIAGHSRALNRCCFCDKIYHDKSTMTRHVRLYCKKKKEKEEIRIILEKQNSKINEIMKMLDLKERSHEDEERSPIINNINNINIGNVVTQVQINNYGDEYVDYVSPDFIKKIKYMTPLNGLLCLTNYIYCNPRRNDNWNITVINLSHDRCKIKSEKYWESKSLNKIAENNLIRTACRMNDIIDNAAVSEDRDRDEKGFPILDEFEKRLIECYNHLNDEKYAKQVKEINRRHKDCLIDHCERNKLFLYDQILNSQQMSING